MDGLDYSSYSAYSSSYTYSSITKNTNARYSTAKVKMSDRATLHLFYRSVLIINFSRLAFWTLVKGGLVPLIDSSNRRGSGVKQTKTVTGRTAKCIFFFLHFSAPLARIEKRRFIESHINQEKTAEFVYLTVYATEINLSFFSSLLSPIDSLCIR